jgi:hypothetical protein
MPRGRDHKAAKITLKYRKAPTEVEAFRACPPESQGGMG